MIRNRGTGIGCGLKFPFLAGNPPPPPPPPAAQFAQFAVLVSRMSLYHKLSCQDRERPDGMAGRCAIRLPASISRHVSLQFRWMRSTINPSGPNIKTHRSDKSNRIYTALMIGTESIPPPPPPPPPPSPFNHIDRV